MAFKDSLRLEQIYFQKLKDMIKTCKAWYDGENTDKDRDILEALIQACAAILLLYRNLGEEWNELTALIQRTMHDLVYLKEKTDVYHDELNEKIDEVNNYLNAAITIIEAQIDAFGGLPSNANASEGDVLTVGENHVNEWKTTEKGLPHYYFGLKYNENGSFEYVNDIVTDGNNTTRIYKGELIDDEITLSPVYLSSGEETVLQDYFAGKCLISAYVKDYSDEDYIITYCSPIVKAFYDSDEGEGIIAFNLTSPNHHNGTIATGSNYVAALLLTLEVGTINNIYWGTYIGTGIPILEIIN